MDENLNRAWDFSTTIVETTVSNATKRLYLESCKIKAPNEVVVSDRELGYIEGLVKASEILQEILALAYDTAAQEKAQNEVKEA